MQLLARLHEDSFLLVHCFQSQFQTDPTPLTSWKYSPQIPNNLRWKFLNFPLHFGETGWYVGDENCMPLNLLKFFLEDRQVILEPASNRILPGVHWAQCDHYKFNTNTTIPSWSYKISAIFRIKHLRVISSCCFWTFRTIIVSQG